MGSRSFRCNVNSTQVVAGTHLTCLVEQSGEDEYTEWKLLGDAAMGITEVCQCDPGFQLLMTRNELAGTNELLSANAIHKLTLNTDKRTYETIGTYAHCPLHMK